MVMGHSIFFKGHSILMIKLILTYFVQAAVGEDSMQLSQVHFQRETSTATTSNNTNDSYHNHSNIV